MSDEHVFPEAIGGMYKIKNVCRECNSKLGGNIDVLLTNNLIVEMKRTIYDLRGQSGKQPWALKEGCLKENQNHEFHMAHDKNGNIDRYETINSAPVVSEVDGILTLRITIDGNRKNKSL
jgi:hypothetical protein